MINEIKHPLIEHKLAILRDKKTGTKEFREIISELGEMLCYEAMKDAKMYETEIETPMEKMKTRKYISYLLITLPFLSTNLTLPISPRLPSLLSISISLSFCAKSLAL